MKDPAFLFYSSDFLTGVSDLTMEERGQYITLLCLQHQKGELTEKTIRLSVGSVSVCVLSKFSKLENGNYQNKRLKEEAEKRAAFTESRRNNGLKGGRPKETKKPLAKSKDNHMVNHMGNEDENIDIINNTNEEVLNCYNNCLKYFSEELHPKKDTVKNKWLDTIDKLNRIDKIPFELIEEIVKRTREDAFWSKNFLSINKLRQKDKNDIPYITIFFNQFKPKKNVDTTYEEIFGGE